MLDAEVDRALYPAPSSSPPDAHALLARAERAEAEARGLRVELGAVRVELETVRRARDWWMRRAQR